MPFFDDHGAAMTTQAQLETAVRRFEAALARVEEGFSRLAGEKGGEDALATENASLRGEMARMQDDMAALRARARELADLNGQALSRLDKAMEHIRTVLGEEA